MGIESITSKHEIKCQLYKNLERERERERERDQRKGHWGGSRSHMKLWKRESGDGYEMVG